MQRAPPPPGDSVLTRKDRTRKRRCDIPDDTVGPCWYCTEHNLQCSLARNNSHDALNPRSNGASLMSPILSTRSWSPPPTRHHRVPSPALCKELINLYFRYIHDTFHSLFHQPSLLEDLAGGTIPQIILLAIISLSARFSQHTFFENSDPRSRGKAYAVEAAQLLDLRDVSITTIRASVLLGAFAITEGEAEAESIYYSIACRLAMLMDLPIFPVDNRIDQETNIRMWWALNMIDVWSSNGVGLPRSIKPRYDVPYPMDETSYLRMRRDNFDPPAATTVEESAASLLTQMVKLNAILFEVSELNRTAISETYTRSMTAVELDAAVCALGQKLDEWHANIPSEMKDTPENIERYAQFGLGYIFVAVYLGYYHYGQLLYYHYLDENLFLEELSYNEGLRTRAGEYANKCRDFSTALCGILYRSYSTPGCEVYYTMVGHVVVVASTIQLFTLMFSSSEVDTMLARKRLENNFEILTKLQKFWPTLDVSFNRFREFHDACLRRESNESNFRMDRWMLQFLFEFARPVSKRDAAASVNQGHQYQLSAAADQGLPAMNVGWT